MHFTKRTPNTQLFSESLMLTLVSPELPKTVNTRTNLVWANEILEGLRRRIKSIVLKYIFQKMYPMQMDLAKSL